MKPAPFDYHRPATVAEALALKARLGGEARFLAGGQSLVPAMNFRLARPAALIDLNEVAGLSGIAVTSDGWLRLPALTRHRDLERHPEVARRQPLLGEAVAEVAHPQIRTRGTLGGNLCHADPASELPAVMVALEARLLARSTRGERWIAAADFFTGIHSTRLEEDELLAEVAVPPLPARTGTCFVELARRRGDFALMGVAAAVTLDGNGVCVAARLSCCNAADRPLDAARAAAGLIGRRPDRDAVAAVAAAVRAEARPIASIHASAAYLRHLAGELTARALARAAERAAT